MRDDKQLLPPDGGCPHCGGTLLPATDNGMLVVCEQCHCMFFGREVVSFKRCNPGDLAQESKIRS
jgi:hypothetical protein